jgi:hypothetical protein
LRLALASILLLSGLIMISPPRTVLIAAGAVALVAAAFAFLWESSAPRPSTVAAGSNHPTARRVTERRPRA